VIPWHGLGEAVRVAVIATGLLVSCSLSWYAYVQYKREKYTTAEGAGRTASRYQARKKDYFNKKDAYRIYRRIGMLLREWRNIAEGIRTTRADNHAELFEQNERVRQIRLEIKKIREECGDRALDEKLGALIDLEWFNDRTFVSSPNATNNYATVFEADRTSDRLNQAIREYINKRIKD